MGKSHGETLKQRAQSSILDIPAHKLNDIKFIMSSNPFKKTKEFMSAHKWDILRCGKRKNYKYKNQINLCLCILSVYMLTLLAC